ncbi:2Fe-2S iron-sulfur cluster-binding protein [Kyrpidia sp.]|uniref:2Fe-2S iron-sulfur cluster-binding protein n=1 Tax=Kyrpidia sp. TaxID=2073077 RepID=UPI0025865742|nr:2Fe-2S iron-sulfur cluster-binding protein [Kyrpidia sp.]MCL6576813.1 2Fe-2S iron-sulfur cluster binding domain-containing protein [Kyrpidia sp.]
MANEYRIFVANKSREYLCRYGQNILSSSIEQGVRVIKRGCLGGGCGFCKIRVEAGQYELGKVSIKALPAEERKEGFVLACKTVPLSDLVIRVSGD